MKSSTLTAVCVLAASTLALVPVTARQMQADIDYERYLAELDDFDVEYQAWKGDYWKTASENNWVPDYSEERSSDDMEEDLRQRVFKSKQDVLNAQAANPNANFSIMTPFSALSNDEFATKVLNAHVRANRTSTKTAAPATAAPKRSLRQQDAYTFSSMQDMIDALMQSLQEQAGGSWTVATVKPATDATANEADSPAPTQAPIPVTQAPIPVTAAPKTAAPSPTPTTRAPVVQPTTKQPSTPVQTEKGVAVTSNSVDWSSTKCMSPVQSQGQCGSCWAFASVAAVESLQCIKGGQHGINKYSEQQVVGCDSQNMGCGGGAPVYAFEYIQQNGLCTEDALPYSMSNGGSATCYACSKSQTGITGFEKIDEGDEAGLIEALKSQPVVAAVASGNAAWKQYTGGVMSYCETTELDHAVLIVGYDDSTFKVRNSWGENWGEAGYVRMERSSSGTGTCGMLSDMSRPTM
jgi:C1A family cysteine protease